MEIGRKLREERISQGLSQRQLCQELITRNMLSLIENGSARPSMEVLCTLAARLGKPVGYFLGEEEGAKQSLSEQGRAAYSQGRFREALELFRDGPLTAEGALLCALCCLEEARLALEEQRLPYARKLLEQCREFGEKTPYDTGYLEKRRLLLLAEADPDAGELPDLDEELMLLARALLAQKAFDRAGKLLDGTEKQDGGKWHLLRGRAFFGQGAYRAAAKELHLAESEFPGETAPMLEICYRELEDYKMAYFYARKSGT